MTTTYRDPRASIVRDVLLYPANGDKPHICKMTFNEAGSKHTYGLYTTAVDLRLTYGTHMSFTRIQRFDIQNQPDKNAEGDYIVYYNLSPALPANAAMALLVGINPKRPGQRPLWRGDVVVVKTQEWPLPIGIGEGAHMDYVDIPLSTLSIFNRFLQIWYSSEEWGNTLKNEREMREFPIFPLFPQAIS